MARRIAQGIVFLGAALLAACSGEPPTGPVKVKWDRDQCERCRMVVSDPYHAAQIRQPAGQGRTKVYRFDDFGCAVIWLDKQSWRDVPGVEFWVTDHRSGDWIDARKAWYVLESNRSGGMGAAEAVPFATKEGAESFRTKQGGKVYAFASIPEDYIQQ